MSMQPSQRFPNGIEPPFKDSLPSNPRRWLRFATWPKTVGWTVRIEIYGQPWK